MFLYAGTHMPLVMFGLTLNVSTSLLPQWRYSLMVDAAERLWVLQETQAPAGLVGEDLPLRLIQPSCVLDAFLDVFRTRSLQPSSDILLDLTLAPQQLSWTTVSPKLLSPCDEWACSTVASAYIVGFGTLPSYCCFSKAAAHVSSRVIGKAPNRLRTRKTEQPSNRTPHGATDRLTQAHTVSCKTYIHTYIYTHACILTYVRTYVPNYTRRTCFLTQNIQARRCGAFQSKSYFPLAFGPLSGRLMAPCMVHSRMNSKHGQCVVHMHARACT